MKSETIKLPSGRSWEIYSGGTGPALLWLHGLRGVDPLDPVLVALQRKYRVVAPVAPGFNDLSEIDHIDTIHDLALDYDDLLSHLKLTDVTIAGHSFGGMIAAEISAHFPARAARLILLAPLGLWNDAYPVADIFAVPYAQMDDMLWHDAAARAQFAKPVSNDLEIKEAADQMILLVRSLTAVTKFVWPIPDRGLARRLHRIACPTLLLIGQKDAVLSPRYADDFKRGIKKIDCRAVEGAGHMLSYEQPAQVLAAIG